MKCQASVPVSSVLVSAGCYEDINLGQERCERPLPQQLHFHIYLKVFGFADLSLQVDSTCEAVQLPGAEVALFVTLCDANDNMVSRVSRGRADSEDLGWNDDVGLEGEMVVGDPQGRVLTV